MFYPHCSLGRVYKACVCRVSHHPAKDDRSEYWAVALLFTSHERASFELTFFTEQEPECREGDVLFEHDETIDRIEREPVPDALVRDVVGGMFPLPGRVPTEPPTAAVSG